MLKKEFHVLLPLVQQPWKKFTFKQLKDIAKKTSKSYVLSVLKKMVGEKILIEERVGNTNLYQLNHRQLKAHVYAGMVAQHRAWTTTTLPFRNIQKLGEKVPLPFYLLIITGSYARGTQKETSDLDAVIIINNTEDTKHVYAQLHSVCEFSIPEIHLYVFKKSEFLEMLLNKQANYGKEIAMNNLLLYGAEIYYNIISEAIDHGFNDKSLS